MSTFFERIWLFSFTNPRWALKHLPSINESTVAYGLLLMTVPGWILQLVFPNASTLGSLGVLACGIALHLLLGYEAPGVFWSRVGTETVEWNGQHGTVIRRSNAFRCFTPWKVLRRQLTWVMNFFVIGMVAAYLYAPGVLVHGFSLETSWQLIASGAILLGSVLIPLMLAIRLCIWAVRSSLSTSETLA